jgi:hypothetical protein
VIFGSYVLFFVPGDAKTLRLMRTAALPKVRSPSCSFTVAASFVTMGSAVLKSLGSNDKKIDTKAPKE